MKTMGESWERFLARVLVLGVVVMAAAFIGNKLANAEVGGRVRDSLTVSGTLETTDGRPVSPTPRLDFVFRKAGAMECTTVARSVEYQGTRFQAEIPIDAGVCRGFFDGADVTVEVRVNGMSIGAPRPVNGVPYAHYASVAGQYGTPDCPVGYEENPASPSGRTYCRRALTSGNYDEVVRVGTGSTAFWIDRYEAMICDSRDGACTALLNVRSESDLASRGLPRNGQWVGQTPPLFAISIAASNPPARWVTWFQAEELCRASGKRLPTGGEWLTAARGTGGTTGDVGCQISATDPRDITTGAACASDWGAQDMVGNLWEWTAEWYAAPGDTNPVLYDQPPTPDAGVMDPWSQRSLYGDDRTTNITSSAGTRFGGGGNVLRGLPSAPIRGGGWGAGARGGKFAMDLNYGPSFWSPDIGFRCVIPR